MYFNELKIGMTVDVEPITIEKEKTEAIVKIKQ